MRVIQLDEGVWVIADHFRTLDAAGISGSRSHASERVREIKDFWTGKNWSGQSAFAMTFPSKEAGEQYMASNFR
jgi:hypothetical protein